MEGRYWIWLVARLLMAVIIVGWAASYLTPAVAARRRFVTIQKKWAAI